MLLLRRQSLWPNLLLGVLHLLPSTQAAMDISRRSDPLMDENDPLKLSNEDYPLIAWGNDTKLVGSWWTEWSVCSRTCGVGVQQQLRRCSPDFTNSSESCHYREQTRYRLCNIQPCEDEDSEPWEEWRSFMCSAYDSIPWGVGGSQRMQWTPVHEPLEPCALVCRGIEVGLSGSASHVVLAALAPQVPDGTRCHPHALHVCISGRCMDVSCKSFMGTVKNISCVDWDHHGQERLNESSLRRVPISECSVTCGTGWQSVMYEDNYKIVDRIERVKCLGRAGKCPPAWFVGPWDNCSCSGVHQRLVVCGIEGRALRNSKCPLPVPEKKERCKPPPECNDSGAWLTESWSPCSVTCGRGVSVRGVRCRRPKTGNLTEPCGGIPRPDYRRSCLASVPCPPSPKERKKRAVRVYGNTLDLENLLNTSFSNIMTEEEMRAIKKGYAGVLTPDIIERMTYEMLPKQASYRWMFDGQWSGCNVNCGQGWKTLSMQCQILLDNSNMLGIVAEEMCEGEKPPVQRVQACNVKQCEETTFVEPIPKASLVQPVTTQDASYTWRETGYTSCSASCLSGVQELIISCIRDSDGKNASPYMCDPRLRPESRVRTCNDHPCPPRWNISDYGPCDKPCGMGMQEREVFCMHEVTRGSSNRVRVPHSMCPQPMPSDRQFCNAFDCPPAWKAEAWSECSRSCGIGSRIRRVYCHQMMVQSRNEEVAPNMCEHLPKPVESEPCGTDCHRDRRVSTTVPPHTTPAGPPHIISQNVTYHQHDGRLRYVTTAVGGRAVVMHGTMLRIHCPSHNIDTSTIKWYHDGKFVEDSEYYRIFPEESALRIETAEFMDAGNWECRARANNKTLTSTSLFLSVKSRPLSGSSEELGKSSHLKPGRGHQSLHYSNNGQEEHSHEREFLVTPKPRRFTTLPPPTLPNTMRPYQPPTKPAPPNNKRLRLSRKRRRRGKGRGHRKKNSSKKHGRGAQLIMMPVVPPDDDVIIIRPSAPRHKPTHPASINRL